MSHPPPEGDAPGPDDRPPADGQQPPQDPQPPNEQPPYGPPAPAHQPAPYGRSPYPAAQPGGGYPPDSPVAGTNTMAILSLVFAFLFPPLGVVFGHLARNQLRRTGESGAALATAGLVLSYVFVGLALLGCCGALVLAANSPGAP